MSFENVELPVNDQSLTLRRIKNGTFEIDGQTSNIPTNEHGGEDTLHGGFIGYDQQNWTVASVTGNSITFVSTMPRNKVSQATCSTWPLTP